MISFSNDVDGFVVDKNGFIPSFANIKDLQGFANQEKIIVDIENPNMIDLDSVKNWLNNYGEIEDYNPFLEAWNLFEDISISLNGNFDKDKENTNDIYNRIFWGCNISAVTPEGESFTPTWTIKELEMIKETLKNGFRLFNEKIKTHL